MLAGKIFAWCDSYFRLAIGMTLMVLYRQYAISAVRYIIIKQPPERYDMNISYHKMKQKAISLSLSLSLS